LIQLLDQPIENHTKVMAGFGILFVCGLLSADELVTIPGLHDGDEWTRFEAARRSMLPQFGTSVPAPRYRNQARRSAYLPRERVRSSR